MRTGGLTHTGGLVFALALVACGGLSAGASGADAASLGGGSATGQSEPDLAGTLGDGIVDSASGEAASIDVSVVEAGATSDATGDAEVFCNWTDSDDSGACAICESLDVATANGAACSSVGLQCSTFALECTCGDAGWTCALSCPCR